MGNFRNKVLGDPAKIKAHREALDALMANTDTTETDEYHRLNDAVNAARREIPAWRR